MDNPFQILSNRIENLERLITALVDKLDNTDKPLAYSKKAFAKAIGKSTQFVDSERRKNRLEWKRNGGTVSIPAKEIEKYI